MNNQELLFNLIKKLASGEITFAIQVTKEENKQEFFFKVKDEDLNLFFTPIKIGQLPNPIEDNPLIIKQSIYQEEWNQEFKEKFYQEKGLDKCWVKECPNKIYQVEGDYKKIKILCQDKHTRMVCLACADQLPESKKQPEKILKNHDN